MKFFSLKFILLIAILIAIVCINAKYEIFAVNFPKDNVKEEGSFRVMTYNVFGSPVRVKDVEEFRRGLIEEIDKQNPDVLCMQEMTPPIFKQISNSLDSIFEYTDSMAVKKEPLRYWIYSKKPIRNFQRYKCVTEIDTVGLDSIKKVELKQIKRQMPVYSAEIGVEPDRWITIFTCHLMSSAYSTARRSMDDNAKWSDGLPLYYHNYIQGKIIRDYEIDNLNIYLDSLKATNSPIIIAGDFNDWSGSYCLETLKNGVLKDAWWEGGFGFGNTYDAWHLRLRLDHILYSPHFELKNVHVEESELSDHYPLIADFKL